MHAKKVARLAVSTCHQLEAEQVIPDLSCAIKELIENALDSKPSTITITFFNQGFDSIILEDDGEGILPEDMEKIALNRYSTSKIVYETDLETSINYGFRGEALHSIAKLSKKLMIFSSVENSDEGLCKLFSEFGTSINIFNKPRSKGTSVTVEGLFENVSVRRQDWFKRKGFIFSQAVFLLQSFAILTPNVKFCAFLVNDKFEKKNIMHSIGKDISSRYAECMRNDAKKIVKIDNSFSIKKNNVSMCGVFVKNLKDLSKNRIVIFINRKPFESPKWQKSLIQMLRKNFAAGVEFFINVELPSLWIDFNVTPDKRTILILHESEILAEIIKYCEIYVRKELVIESNFTECSKKIDHQNETSSTFSDELHLIDSSREFLSIGLANPVELAKQDIKKLVPIGQFNNGFIICTIISGNFKEIFAVDQHAADERIRFEEIAATYLISCQKLVQPIKLELSAEDEDFVLRNFEIIRAAGFQIRESGGKLFLDALPNFHGAESKIEDFKEMIDYLKDHGLLYKNLCPKFHRILASRACRSAIMIGAPLAPLQIQKILNKLSETDYPWICAHGRPTIQFLKRLNYS